MAAPTPSEPQPRILTAGGQVAEITRLALERLGASAAVTLRLASDGEGEYLTLDGAARVPSEVRARLGRLTLDRASALGEALRREQFVSCGSRREIVERYPELATVADALEAHAFCAMPVRHQGATRGVIALAFRCARSFYSAERAQLRALATRYGRELRELPPVVGTRSAGGASSPLPHATPGDPARPTPAGDRELSPRAMEIANAVLEERIASRTAELAEANEALLDEIVVRTRAEAERNVLRRQLASAEEEERRRIARELHDQLGQHLTALSLGLAEVSSAPDVGHMVRARVERLQVLAVELTQDVRTLAVELRPPELDDLGFGSALSTHLARWATRYPISTEVEMTGLEERTLPAEVATTLYRVLQEALRNVARHAHACHVSVIVEQTDEEVRLIIEDDGCGFDVDALARQAVGARRLGLAGMHERAALVGGTLVVESSVGQGTTLYVRLPVYADGADLSMAGRRVGDERPA